MYHVGRPGHDGYVERVLKAWGIDGHNSHTNVCSGAARLGYALWSGYDRPSPDHENARFILLISSHLESGHYFNPHAQRIIEGKLRGAKLAVMDTRLSNTASMADHWMPTYPGSEAAVLLAMARVILDEGLAGPRLPRALDELATSCWPRAARAPPATFARFLDELKEHLRPYTPERRRGRVRRRRERSWKSAREIGRARGAFASHVWRTAAGQPGRLAGRALPAVPHGPDRQRSAPPAARICRTPGHKCVAAPFWKEPPGQKSGTSCSSPASGRSRTTRCPSCSRTS